jgi:hypothetical protein
VQPFAVSDAVALLSLRRSSFRFVSHRPSDFSASCGPGLRLSVRPSPSGLCSTPESATTCRRFRPTRAHGSFGLCVLQGSPPPRHNRAFTRFPLTSFLASISGNAAEAARPRSPPRLPRVSVTEEIGSASRLAPPKQRHPRVLPTLLNFLRLLTTHASAEPQPVRESPPRESGCIAVP